MIGRLCAIAAALLTSASAVDHHRASHHAKHLHAKHHEKRQSHKHHAAATHHAKHHEKHHAEHHAAVSVKTYASVKHSLDRMVERNTAAEAELGDASRKLQETILDVALSQGSPNASLRGTSKPAGNASAVKNHQTAALKLQQGKLGDLFNHLKSNIAEFNKREADQKKDSSVFAERLKKRLAEDKKRLNDPNSTMSDFDHKMLVNRTRTEEHELKFWTTGRSLQHDMFHSNLKLTHGLMGRVKTILDAYKQVAATGKLDPKLSEVLKETAAKLPKALLQKDERVKKDVKKIEKHLEISAKLLHRA